MTQATTLSRINQIEPLLGPEEKAEILQVLESGWITEAGKTAEFERLVAEYAGAQHATATVNGTVTLYMALLAADVGPGDEVLVPDLTMIASPNAITATGARPIFVDIEPETFCIDLDLAEAAITPRTKAIMPVHMNGRSPDMRRLCRTAEERGLFIIEDAAQGLGSQHEGKHLGTWGHVGSFSFSTPKIITTGQGGMLVTNDPALHQRLYEIKDFGRKDRKAERHGSLGFNFKFTDLQAAIGVAQMRKLPERVARKKAMARLYGEQLSRIHGVMTPATDLDQVAPWFFDAVFEDRATRDRVRASLAAEQIGTRPFYSPCHLEGPYAGQGGAFPATESASGRGLWLPSSVFLSDEDIVRVCDAVRRALSPARRGAA